MREDNSDSHFPVKRMPMGLFEYTVSFFSESNHHKVSSYNIRYTKLMLIIVAGDCVSS